VIDHRRHIAVALQDGGLNDAVVEDPAVAVVGEGHRIVDRDFGYLRQHMGGRLHFDGWLHFGGLLRHYAVGEDNCQGKRQRYDEEPCFGHDATFQDKPGRVWAYVS
jgi:hypothetical protein